MAKNNGFRAYAARQKEKSLGALELMKQLCDQACLDAIILTLGYGECMKSDPWGQERMDRFCREWAQNVAYVCRGYMPEDPESDAIRADVDRRLQAKVPEREFVSWFGRYPIAAADHAGGGARRLREKMEEAITNEPPAANAVVG